MQVRSQSLNEILNYKTKNNLPKANGRSQTPYPDKVRGRMSMDELNTNPYTKVRVPLVPSDEEKLRLGAEMDNGWVGRPLSMSDLYVSEEDAKMAKMLKEIEGMMLDSGNGHIKRSASRTTKRKSRRHDHDPVEILKNRYYMPKPPNKLETQSVTEKKREYRSRSMSQSSNRKRNTKRGHSDMFFSSSLGEGNKKQKRKQTARSNGLTDSGIERLNQSNDRNWSLHLGDLDMSNDNNGSLHLSDLETSKSK